jgi:hypothetical protein
MKDFLFVPTSLCHPDYSVNLQGKETEIKQSNPQQKEFTSTSKLISYKTKTAKSQRSIILSANYDTTIYNPK